MSEHVDRVRPRDAAATRAALLRSATEMFAERGFDQVTVRQIAARAGVNQALLFRYFGSKRRLFVEVLKATGIEHLELGDDALLPERMLRGILAPDPQSGAEHPMMTALRSFDDEQAAQVLREDLGPRYTARLASLTGEPDEELRADLVLAWFYGVVLLRSALGKRPLAEAAPEVILPLMMSGVRTLLERVAESPAAGNAEAAASAEDGV